MAFLDLKKFGLEFYLNWKDVGLKDKKHFFCRYMGTITGISDIDPVRWKNSQWRNLQVEIRACFCFSNQCIYIINIVDYTL